MASYPVFLKRKQQVADGTLAFYFDKPADFVFKAGQCVRLVLIDPPETDGEGNGRILSLASTPAEAELMVATRIRSSAFKRVLSTLAPGTELTLKGPYGDFVLPADPHAPLVFITGGIGITPVRSMLLQALSDGEERRLLLFYANRRPQDAPFLEELQQACAGNARCTLVATMTAPSAPGWQGERGYVDEAMLARYLDDVQAPFYFLDGPPALVAAMRALLGRLGVAEERVRTEEFAGY
ncbi:ferredoxin--NADP reductase [Zobellella iuensis]|uniref:FAD-dependent oxidoreductase n=1 Tax=Zobellella iuensis TaxID=2803811 RepID=A0ABS1QVW3_9GAMM|nr:FAD-dependent oxidoreductase [Zobellella iuensis]MBL1379020.1 FAD-dependent oxidoreductase [Zobellella iuensis]